MATGSYTVTSQAVDQYDFSAPGNPVLGTVVYFVTGNGHQGSVFVPQARYTINNVKTLVEGAAKSLDAVGSITGTY
jgi:hypothetical protein